MLADSPRFFFLIRRPAHAITVLQNSVFSMESSVANSNFSDSKDHQRKHYDQGAGSFNFSSEFSDAITMKFRCQTDARLKST